jgi:hypothetical protein
MGSLFASVRSKNTRSERHDEPFVGDDRAEFVEAPECRTRSGRGALVGLFLGAGLWAAILAVTGVIKL